MLHVVAGMLGGGAGSVGSVPLVGRVVSSVIASPLPRGRGVVLARRRRGVQAPCRSRRGSFGEASLSSPRSPTPPKASEDGPAPPMGQPRQTPRDLRGLSHGRRPRSRAESRVYLPDFRLSGEGVPPVQRVTPSGLWGVLGNRASANLTPSSLGLSPASWPAGSSRAARRPADPWLAPPPACWR
jgi:hypothetical protein